MSIKPYRPEELQSSVASLNQENTVLAFCDRSEAPHRDLPKIQGMNIGWGGNFFTRQFKSEDISSRIMPTREQMEKFEKEPMLITVCQGFPATEVYP